MWNKVAKFLGGTKIEKQKNKQKIARYVFSIITSKKWRIYNWMYLYKLLLFFHIQKV